jgi:hypothetical protein
VLGTTLQYSFTARYLKILQTPVPRPLGATSGPVTTLPLEPGAR